MFRRVPRKSKMLAGRRLVNGLIALGLVLRGTHGKILNPMNWFSRGTAKLRLELGPLGTAMLVGSVSLLFGLITGTLLAVIAFPIGPT